MSDGSDIGWLGLERAGPGTWTFEVTPGLSRMDGRFYGGTGIAATTAVTEAETGRRAVWASVQFVASGVIGDQVLVQVDIGAAGRRTSQVRVRGWIGDRLLFAAIGAAAAARPATDATAAIDVGFAHMPDVPDPADCPPWDPFALADRFRGRPGWLALSDIRDAGPDRGLWMRMRDRPMSRAGMAFLADVIPSGVMRAAGQVGAGTSLDNTIRFGPEPTGDWMLVRVDPHMISGGYIHGGAHLWSADGALIGVASQTAGAILFDQ